MAKMDLHVHSMYSADGELSVKAILEKCKQEGVECLAITDHNTVRGVPEARALGAQMGIQVLSGVELDCVHRERNLHLLGYRFDASDPVFAQIEQNIVKQEQAAALKKIELVQREIGVPLCAQEVLEAAGNGFVTGELIAEILLTKKDAQDYPALLPYLSGGSRSDNPYVNFYWDYCAQGKAAYVPITYLSLEEGIALLHAAGGVAVLAHPAQNLKGEYDFIEQIVAAGIDGIEAYTSYHTAEDTAYFAEVARKHKLFVTCGSDFHGKTKPTIPLCGGGVLATERSFANFGGL